MTKADVIFEWTVHPFADFPRRRLVFLAVVGVTLACVWIAFRDIFWVLFSLVFLVSALNSFLLPTRYRLSETELEIFRLIQVKLRKLSDVRRVDCEPNGFFLSPLRQPARLENYRGVFLPYPKERRDEVKEFLLRHVRPADYLGGKNDLRAAQ
jgi:hypothetical protein